MEEKEVIRINRDDIYKLLSTEVKKGMTQKSINLEWSSLALVLLARFLEYGMIIAAFIILCMHGKVDQAILAACFCICYYYAQNSYMRSDYLTLAVDAGIACLTAWMYMNKGSVLHLCAAVFVLFLSYTVLLRGLDFLADAEKLQVCAEAIKEDTIKEGKPVVVTSTFRKSDYRFAWKIELKDKLSGENVETIKSE